MDKDVVHHGGEGTVMSGYITKTIRRLQAQEVAWTVDPRPTHQLTNMAPPPDSGTASLTAAAGDQASKPRERGGLLYTDDKVERCHVLQSSQPHSSASMRRQTASMKWPKSSFQDLSFVSDMSCNICYSQAILYIGVLTRACQKLCGHPDPTTEKQF